MSVSVGSRSSSSSSSASSESTSSGGQIEDVPILNISWPNLNLLSKDGDWIKLIQDAKSTHTTWNQAINYQMILAKANRRSSHVDSLTDPDGDSDESGGGSGSSGSASADRNSSDSSSSSSVRPNTVGSDSLTNRLESSRIAADTQLQTNAFCIANYAQRKHDNTVTTTQGSGDASIESASSSFSSSTSTLPSKLADRLRLDATDFTLADSSFGDLYEQRLAVVRSLFAALYRFEQQQLARQRSESTFSLSNASAATSAASAAAASPPPFPPNFFKKSSPSNETSADIRNAFANSLFGGDSLPSQSGLALAALSNKSTPGQRFSSNDAIEAVDALIDTDHTWPTLPGRDVDASGWPSEVASLAAELNRLKPAQLRKEYVHMPEMVDWMRKAISRLPSLDSAIQSQVLSCLVSLSLQLCQPAVMLMAVRAILTTPDINIADIDQTMQQLAHHQNQLDISVPFSSSLDFTHSQPLPGSVIPLGAAASAASPGQPQSINLASFSNRGQPSAAQGMATDGTYLYLHTRDGLEKIGSGFNGTTRGQRYGYRSDYRPTELVRICCVAGKLYCLSSRMVWPRVEVLSTSDLTSLGFLQLGVDPEFSSPDTSNQPIINPFMTDGKLLYLLQAEEVDEATGDSTAGECIESLLAILSELEQSKRSDITEADARTIKEELMTLVDTLRSGVDERAARYAQESLTSPRMRAPGRREQAEARKPIAPAKVTTAPQADSKENVSKSSSPPVTDVVVSGSAPAAPAAPTPLKTPATKKGGGGFYASWNERNRSDPNGTSESSLVTPNTKKATSFIAKVRAAQAMAEKIIDARNAPAMHRKDTTVRQYADDLSSSDVSPVVPLVVAPSTPAKSSSSNGSKQRRKVCKITLYVYDPTRSVSINHSRACEEDLLLTEDQSATKISQSRARLLAARDLSAAFGHTYSVSVCVTALKKSRDDKNAASRWLLDNGDEYRNIDCAPLVKSLVIANVHPQLTADYLAQSVTTYVTPQQLILLVPPHSSPFTPDERGLARVISLEDGMLFDEYRGSMIRVSGQVCFDPTNNIIWSGTLQHSIAIAAYANHGPATSQPSTPIGSISRSHQVGRFILEQIDRNLNHRDTSIASEPPLIDTVRMQIALLSHRSESIQSNLTSLRQHLSTPIESTALDTILPCGDIAEVNEFPSAFDGTELERLFGLVLSERPALNAIVDQRNNTNRQPAQRGAKAARATESLSTADRIPQLESKLARIEKQLAALTAILSELDSPGRSFCARAHRQPFCIGVEDEIFTQLHELMASVLAHSSDSNGAYAAHVCIRLLLVHLQLLLKHSTEQLPTITHSKQLRQLLLTLALSDEHDDDANQRTAAPATGSGRMRSLKSLACNVLITGIRVFYPSQQDRIRLLTDLMRDFHIDDGQADAASPVASKVDQPPSANKKQLFLQGILEWFSSQLSLADILLVHTSTGDADGAGAPVDAGSFIRSLLDYSLKHEFQPFQRRITSTHSEVQPESPTQPSPASPTAAAEPKSASQPPITPCLSLLLVLQQDLIIKSGILFAPNGVDVHAATPQNAIGRKAKSLEKLLPSKSSVSLFGVSSSSSDDLPASAPQLVSASSAGPIWPGLTMQSEQQQQSDEPFEITALTEETNVRTSQTDASTMIRPEYFSKLLDYTYAILERCESLIDEVTIDELTAGGATRSTASCVPLMMKNSILLLLPALLTSLGSPRAATQSSLLTPILPHLQSILVKLDRLNSHLPGLRSEDAKYSRLLAGERASFDVFETPHPYPSGFRVLKQTIHIPGATHIAWTFDPRSCTANGNDTLRFFADPAMKQPIGSIYYGNDRDGNRNWPQSTVLTLGDTATLCFSARAQPKRGGDRVDNTIRFGFKCIARGVFLQPLSWLLDVEQMVSGLMARIIRQSMTVACVTPQEVTARTWFQYPLLSEGLEEAILHMSTAAAIGSPAPTPIAHTRALALSPLNTTRALDSATAKSPQLAFLDRLIEGHPDANSLWAELDRHNVAFAGKMLVKRLPPPLQQQWTRSIRALMAAMIKHAGLAGEVYAAFGPTADATISPSSHTRAILIDRLKFIATSSKGLQNWMIEQIQSHNEWNQWFSSDRMNATMEPKHKRRPTTQLEKVAISELSPVAETPTASPAAASDDADREEPYESKSPIHSAAAAEEKEVEEKMPESSSIPPTPTLTSAVTDAAAPPPIDDVECELSYAFTFGLNDLKEEYGTHPAKVKAICTIKRIPLRVDEIHTAPSAELDDAIARVFAALERERRTKELHGRMHPQQAYHTLDAALIKQNSYAIVIDQVYTMARALMCFKAVEQPTSALLPPVAPIQVSAEEDAAGSADAPPMATPKFGRAASELPVHSSDSHLLPPVDSGTAMSRTLSRDGRSPRHQSTRPIEERAEDLRAWVHTYTRWKSWQNAHTPIVMKTTGPHSAVMPPWSSKRASPIDVIKLIVKQNLDAKSLVRIAMQHESRAAQREFGLTHLTRALDSLTFEVGRVNLVGFLPETLKQKNAHNNDDSGVNTDENDSTQSSIMSGMEMANRATKARVQERHEELLHVLLSLLKPPVSAAAASSVPSSSPLLGDSPPAPVRRNCYASRLLAMHDIFSLPITTVCAYVKNTQPPATPLPTSPRQAAHTAASCPSYLSKSLRTLLSILADSLSVTRYLRRMSPALAADVAGTAAALLTLAQRESTAEKEENDIRRRQAELAAQVEAAKVYRAQQEQLAKEAKERSAAEAKAREEERLARKAAAAAAKAAADAAGSPAPAPAAVDDGDDDDASRMLGLSLFDSDVDDDSPPEPQSGTKRSSSDHERERRIAEETARAEQEYMRKIQRQFGDAPEDQGPNSHRRDNFGGGGGDVALDDAHDGHMSVVHNRHGHKKHRWLKGAKPRDVAREREEARRNQQEADGAVPNNGDRDGDAHRDADEDGDESGADDVDDGTGKSDSTSCGVKLPLASELNSAFASKQWSALRVVLAELISWDEGRVRGELVDASEIAKSSVIAELNALRSSVLKQLTRELVASVGLARTLDTQNHSWSVRSQLLQLVEQLLTFLLYISPVAFAPTNGAPAGALGMTLLEIIHDSSALTPRITLLALRLARRVLPSLDPNTLWASFTSHIASSAALTSASSAQRSAPIADSLSDWLVQRIGALITAESIEQHRAEQELEYQQRQAKRAEVNATKRNTDTREQKESESKEAESKENDSPLAAASSSSSFPKTHALVVHHRDGFSSDRWAQILSLPKFLPLAYGVRDIKPPSDEDIKARAQCDFERMQKCRKGPSKVACVNKSGSLDNNGENRLSSRSGFNTFVANVGVTGGRWYYQVQLHTRGLLQIGWCTGAHTPSSADGQGVGDDAHSWAYDGMRLKRWHGGHDSYSTSRWNTNDIVGCILDLDVPGGEMSFMLNGDHLGVAYSGFYNASLGPLYPAASLSAGESATWIFDQAKMQRKGSMRVRVPDGFGTLEGDRITYSDPVPMRRAAEITRATEFAGHFTLIQSDYAFCDAMARDLASSYGVLATVELLSHVESLILVDPSLPNIELANRRGPAAFPKQVRTGQVAHATASELVALCRFMSQPEKAESAWADQMKEAIRAAIESSPALLADSDSFSSRPSRVDSLFGSLCVVGGFSESIRVGGLVRISAGVDNAANARALVVHMNDTHVRVVHLTDLVSSLSSQGGGVEPNSHKLPLSQVAPVAELPVDNGRFDVDEKIFKALQQRITANLPPKPAIETAPADTTGASSYLVRIPSLSVYRWALGELKWRSVAVLESLLTNSAAPSSLSLTRASSNPFAGSSFGASSATSADMLIRIGELLVSHARQCQLELKLESVAATLQQLEHQAWNMRNCVDSLLASTPYPCGRGVTGGPSSSSGSSSAVPNPNSFETVYSASSYLEEQVQAPVDDDALLRYWDKHIIPAIQNYVRGSFKPFELEMYTAQLRQPLRQNNQPAAIEIALTLTGGHMPDGIVFPDESRDFLTLTLDDVRIGSSYLVLPTVESTEMWLPSMAPTINQVGRAKSSHPGEELVLLQFYSPQEAILTEYWYPVECLKKSTSGTNTPSVAHTNYDSLLDRLEESQLRLSSLLARRAVFSLISRGGPSADDFLDHSLDCVGGLDSMLEWIFLSVSECLELSDLTRMGEASNHTRETLLAFTTNLIAFINRQRSTGSGDSQLTSTTICNHILRFFKKYIADAAQFSTTKSTTLSFTIQPPSQVQSNGSAIPAPSDASDLWLHLKVERASALVIMYSKDTRLSKGSILSVHPHSDGSGELIKSYSGREESPVLTPLVTPGGECFMRVTPPQDIPARSSMKILPISSFLPLAFWIVELLLNPNTNMTNGEQANRSASAAPATDATLGPWFDGYEDGGLIGLCYTLCNILLSNYELDQIPPSPLKESLLQIVSKLLTRITMAKHADNGSVASGMVRPTIRRQISEANSLSQTKSLAILRGLHSEMVSLYASESANLVFTSYLQQLVDLLAASDELRAPQDRLCSKFEFRAALTEEEKKAKELAEAEAAAAAAKAAAQAGWVCPMCTFENSTAAPGCDMCGTPKPKKSAAPPSSGGDSSSSSPSDSSAMFHDMMSLVGAMRLLNGDHRPEESPAVMAMMEACWKETKRDQVEQRVVVIENVPEGDKTLVAHALAKALRQSDATIRVDPSAIFIGVDASKPPINEPPPVVPSLAKDAPNKRKSTGASSSAGRPSSDVFTFSSLGDESGMIYYLGALAKAERGDPNWVNPSTASSLVLSASSTDSGSDPLSVIVGRDTKRFSTKNQTKQWIQFELVGYTASLRKYTLRHGETSKNEALRNWKLEGSLDGRNWKMLDERKNDGNLTGKGVYFGYEIRSTPQSKEAYTHFRLTSIGPNSGNSNQLVLGNIEFYGTLKKQAEKAKPFDTPFYAVVPLSSGVTAEIGQAAPVGGAAAQKAMCQAIGRVTLPLHVRPPVPTTSKTSGANAKGKIDARANDESASPSPSPSPSPPAAAAAPSSDKKSSDASKSKSGSKAQVGSPLSGPKSSKVGKGDKGDKAASESKEDAAARQRAADERRRRVEEEKRQRAYQYELDAIAREEASRHVLLQAKPLVALEDHSHHAITNAYMRSKLVQHIEYEFQSTRRRDVNWCEYVPTPGFVRVIMELIRRHAGPDHETPSLSGQPALDEKALTAFLAYAKLYDHPLLSKEVALMRKQASLPTGLESALIIQIMCRIAGANEARIKQNSTALPDSPAQSTQVTPPTPEYPSGAFLLFQWLEDAGYDLNLNPHVDARFEQSVACQQPSYWLRVVGSQQPTSSMEEFNSLDAEKFVDLLHELAERAGEKDILQLQTTQIVLEEADWNRIAQQTRGWSGAEKPHLPLPALRLRYAFLRLFNRLFSALLPLIDLRRTVDPRSIAGLVGRCRPFLFPSVKNRFLGIILDTTAEESKTPQVTVNRLALQLARTRGEPIDFTRDSLFARTFHQIYHKIDPFHLRPIRPGGTEPHLAFEVKFRGEQVVGEGGPWRQLFADLGKELMEFHTLLQPSPNQSGKIGNDRDKYIIKPSAITSQHLQFFEYLGMLFGCCLRTGVRFPLELSSFTFKQLIGEDLTIGDLNRIDQAALDSLRFIESTEDEAALEAINQNFTTKLSDGTMVELKSNGSEIVVDLTNKSEYVGLVIAARLTESQSQIDSIRRGLALIIPIQLLNLLTPRDLELLICGRTLIDIDLLRRHTKYSDVDPNAPHIEHFWNVLEEFDQTHRKAFIKFCWAAESLPADDAEFVRTHTRFLIKPLPYPNPDHALPKSDTCFFNLNLPAFTTLEIMRMKLLYAIQSDDSMNGDNHTLREQENEAQGGRDRRRYEEQDVEEDY